MRKFAFLLLSLVAVTACSRKEKLFSLADPERTGIDFENRIEETPEKNVMVYEYYYNGGGVAAADFNNDGLTDLYFTGNAVKNRLYLNRGSLRFEDATEGSGVPGRDGWSTGVTAADINGDGWIDLYVSYSGPVLKENLYEELYINQGCETGGVPKFREMAREYGLESQYTFTTQATFFDLDNDGDLDMFQSNHGHRYFSPFFNTRTIRNKRHPQFGNRLYRNDNNKFVEISNEAGIHGGGLNFGLSACASDINGDGWIDLYVTNDFEEQDYLYLNNKDGTFTEVNDSATGHISKFSMGSDVADYNNDLLPDILVADMLPPTLERQKLLKGADEYDRYTLMVDSGFHHQNMRNTLQVNRGNRQDGTPYFSEVGQLAGVYKTDWSWSALFADLDNDGLKDIFITNGFLRDFTNMDFLKYTFKDASDKVYREQNIQAAYELINRMPSTKLPNFVFRNNGDFSFTDMTSAWGVDLPQLSSGAVYVDLDNDGDLEIITNNTNEKASVWENHSEKLLNNKYIRVKLRGSDLNSFAIGAKVFVECGSLRQTQEIMPSRGFQSSVDYTLTFGLGQNEGPVKVKVIWPGARLTTTAAAQVNTTVELDQADAGEFVAPSTSDVHHFRDVTADLGFNYVHQENPFIDFKAEPLLLYQFSKAGPYLATADVDGDGDEDFYVGGAAGHPGTVFLQGAGSNFSRTDVPAFVTDRDYEDQGAQFFDADGDGDFDLYVVSGGNEFPTGSPLLQDRLYQNDGKGNFTRSVSGVPQEFSAGSCVKAGDYDRDGDQDLFIGGKCDPGKFPQPAFGGILRNDSENGKIRFTVATQEVNPKLKNPGIITDALWLDINGDQWLDLVLAGEWMPIVVFLNERGVLREVEDPALASNSGLWSSLLAADFDNDGDVDLVAGNAGLNLPWKPTPDAPMSLYWSDFDGNGTIDPVVCVSSGGREFPIASRDELLEQLPSLKKKFVYYKDYAVASIDNIFSAKELSGAKKILLHNLQSTLLLNLGNGRFSASPLPVEAQFSKANSMLAGDYNGDGFNDILVAGNFFPYRVQYGKSDASEGVLLAGQGNGKFVAISCGESGFCADGDVRSMVSIKGSDGIQYLVVGKNSGRLQVFRAGVHGSSLLTEVTSAPSVY